MSARRKKKSASGSTPALPASSASSDEAMLSALVSRLATDATFRGQLRKAFGAATSADRLSMRPDASATLLARVGALPTKGVHVERPGSIERGEGAERAVEVYDLGPDHSSDMRFEVRVVHPEFALHPGNAVPMSRQAPEIARFQRKRDAHAMAHALALALGSDASSAAKAFPGAHVPVPEETAADAPLSIESGE